MSAWYNGPFWPSNLWNWCGRTLLSSESRTNIWTKLHCCFLGHAGLLLDAKRWPSSASCFKPCFVMLLLFTNYCHAATWSLMILSKTGLQIPACVNHLQALFSDVHPPAAGTAVHRGTSLHSHWRGLVTRGGLHWFCINFWESYAQFVRRRKKKKLIFLCKLWRNVKISLISQLWAGFHWYHNNIPESRLGSAALLDAQTKTKPTSCSRAVQVMHHKWG